MYLCKMKKSTVGPSLVVTEIAKRRLAESQFTANRQPKKSALLLRCIPVGKSIIPKPKPKKTHFRKERELKYDIKDLENPFTVPVKDRFFNKTEVKRKQKPTDIPYEEIKTVIDHVHGEFFKVIEGRPLKPPIDIKKHMRYGHQLLLLKCDAAFLRDQILKLDYLMFMSAGEMDSYRKIYKFYQDTVLNFKTFLADSFRETKQAEVKQAEVELQVAHAIEQWEFYISEYQRLSRLIIPMSDKFEVLFIYKQFLDERAPVWWRIENKIGCSGRSMNFKTLFVDDDDDDDDERILEGIKKSVMAIKTIPVKMYFEKPHELMMIFDDMQCYCLRYIQLEIHNTLMVVNPIRKCTEYFKSQINRETEKERRSIELIEGHVKFMEEKVVEYKEKFYKILNNEFRKTASSYCSLKLFLCVQYANAELLGVTPDPKDSLFTLMAQIERKYEMIMIDLDRLDYNVVKKITATVMKKDKVMMRKAYAAQRELKEWAIFEKAIKTSFEPPRYRRPQPKIAVWQRK